MFRSGDGTSARRTVNPRVFDWVSLAGGVGDAHWQLIAQSAVPSGATVLEVGVGTGNLVLKLKRTAPDVTVIGVDQDTASLALAVAKAARHNADIQFDLGDLPHLDYADGTFDRVLSAFVLHHLSRDQQLPAIQEMRRILKPGGSLHLLDFTPAGTDHTVALMGQAELVDCLRVGQGRTRLGHHSFYRATRAADIL